MRMSQLVHISHGFLAGFIFTLDWRVSLFLFAQFVLYEFVEESKIKDELYHEIKEWSIGFALGYLAWLAIIFAFPLFLFRPPATGGGGGNRIIPRLM